jgi:iron complex outermembrane receptor protein
VKTVNPTPEQLAAAVPAGRNSSRPLNPYITPGLPGNTQPLPYVVSPESVSECVPFNILGSGNMSREAIDYVGTDKTHLGYVDQDFAEVLFTGELFDGFGAGAVGFAGGITWRDQQFIATALPVDVDLLGPPINAPALGIRGIPPAFANGGANLHLFSTAPTIGGQTDVWEWFAETNVPLWESASGQRVVTDFAFRRSDYDRSGQIDSWKIGANLEATEDLRFRLTRSRDVREPSFAELFDAQAGGANVMDPQFSNETYLTTVIRGGNQNLRPEVANTKTVGVVYSPGFVSWLDGLSVSLDWYEVNITDAVAHLGAQRIVDECDAGATSLCGTILRGSDKRIVEIVDGFLNVAGAKAEGVDMEVIWRAEPDFLSGRSESFNLRWLTGHTMERSDTPLGGTAQDDAGGLGMPAYTSNLTASYGIDNYSAQVQVRYVDAVKRNLNWVEGVDVDDNHVASMTWFNMRFGYTSEFANGTPWSLGLNIQNVFDKEPPLFGFTNNTYDQYGRRYNLSFNWSM